MGALVLKKFCEWFNRQNTVLLIFILSISNFLGLTLQGGEEQYLAFAKQFMDHAWMPDSFTLNQPAGGNLVFQVIIGFLLRYFTFEQVAFWGRIVNFLLLAFPLALIVKRLKISNIEIAFLLQILFFPHQSVWAGEWIFKNIEEKSFAYIFVFWSINSLLKDKPLISILFTVIATYFHFLVGGWMFSFVLIYFIFRKNLRSIVIPGFAYALLVLPLFIYLAKTYFIGNTTIINGVNTSAIYTFFRLRHHIGMFGDMTYFFSNHFGGVLISVALFLLCLFVFGKIKDDAVQQLNTLNIIIFTQQFIFILVGLFDKNGILMKTYPFRTSALSSFLIILEVTLVLRKYTSNKLYLAIVRKFLARKTSPYRKMIYVNGINLGMLLFLVPQFASETAETWLQRNTFNEVLDNEMLDLIDYAKTSTPIKSVILMADGDMPFSFIRRSERDRFVTEKFTPTNSQTIYEWHKRILLKERLRKDISLIDSLKKVYRIDFLVSDSTYTYPSLYVEKQFGRHYFYKVVN